jgi:hypothetical protein
VNTDLTPFALSFLIIAGPLLAVDKLTGYSTYSATWSWAGIFWLCLGSVVLLATYIIVTILERRMK